MHDTLWPVSAGTHQFDKPLQKSAAASYLTNCSTDSGKHCPGRPPNALKWSSICSELRGKPFPLSLSLSSQPFKPANNYWASKSVGVFAPKTAFGAETWRVWICSHWKRKNGRREWKK